MMSMIKQSVEILEAHTLSPICVKLTNLFQSYSSTLQSVHPSTSSPPSTNLYPLSFEQTFQKLQEFSGTIYTLFLQHRHQLLTPQSLHQHHLELSLNEDLPDEQPFSLDHHMYHHTHLHIHPIDFLQLE